MEEMRNAALAYYANLTDKQQQLAHEFYKKMDTDGDGKITIGEFLQSQSQMNHQFHDALGVFKEVDKDGNGTLDFEEFITLYYMVKSNKFIYCDSCGVHLTGLYFTCVRCFDGGRETYNLCCACFRDKKHKQHHKHETFCDTHTLLLSKSQVVKRHGSKAKGFDLDETSNPKSTFLVKGLELDETSNPKSSFLKKLQKAFETFEEATAMVNTVASACTIM